MLVVEDDRTNRELMNAVLEPLGHEIVTCGSAEEALALTAVGVPDLVLTDRSLPGLDGLELTRRLRSRHGPRPPIVVIAGAAPEDAAEAAVAAGADAYLSKPVGVEALLEVAERLLRPRGAGSEGPAEAV